MGALATSTLTYCGIPLPHAASARTTQPLRLLGSPCGMRVGFAANLEHFRWPGFTDFVTSNFDLLTPEGEMKWSALRPAPNRFDFGPADQLLAFSQRQGMAVHGHNLCWNTGNPDWLKSVLTPRNAERYLTDHITAVVSRYAGKMDSWDVVNEPIGLWFNRADGLYGGPWLDTLGVGYIDIAFHAAAAADPKALRILNIHNVEHGDAYSEKSRQAALALITQLVARKVPVQAIGLESHLDAGRALDAAALTGFIEGIRSMGLEVLVTELDVNDSQISGTLAERDKAVADMYAAYLSMVLPAMNIQRLIFWSVTDKMNWMDYMKDNRWRRADGLSHRCALLDANLNPKAALYSCISALQQVCTQG